MSTTRSILLLAGVALVSIAVGAVGGYLIKGQVTDETYTINHRAMLYVNGTWLRTCAVVCPTWDSYDTFYDDYKMKPKPPCPIVVWPNDEDLPERMRNFSR